MKTNWHITTAFLVAPVLTLIGYFSVDYWVKEPARPAEKNRSYPLLEKSNCRYPSGYCELNNGDITLTITTHRKNAHSYSFKVKSNLALDGITIALIEPTVSAQQNSISYREVSGPAPMKIIAKSPQEWQTTLSTPQPNQRIRIALSAANTYYYGEAATLFINRNSNDHN